MAHVSHLNFYHGNSESTEIKQKKNGYNIWQSKSMFIRRTKVNRPDGNGNPFWKRIFTFHSKVSKRIVVYSRTRPIHHRLCAPKQSTPAN